MVDVYDLIVNKEIAEFGRKNWNLSIKEKVAIIQMNYELIELKIETLYDLYKETGDKFVYDAYMDTCNALSLSRENHIFVANKHKYLSQNCLIDTSFCYGNSFEDIMGLISDEDDIYAYYTVDVLSDDAKIKATLYVGMFHEVDYDENAYYWAIFKVETDDTPTIYFNHPLPFNDNDIVYIQTPIMPNELRGVVERYDDSYYCFIYDNKNNPSWSILPYTMKIDSSPYMLFDFIKKSRTKTTSIGYMY